MHKHHLLNNDTLYQYLLDVSSRESDVQKKLREATIAKVEQSRMMTSVEQAQFLKFLVELIDARRAIEIGVFTGYGTLAIASGMPAEGELIGCELNKEWTEIGVPFWDEAKVRNKIKLKFGPALETLKNLLAEGLRSSFDFIFIDADKSNYDNYYDLAVQLVRPGGLIAVDNCILLGGTPVYEKSSEPQRIIDEFNHRVHKDSRVEISLVPVGAGMFLIRKRSGN